MICKRTEFLKLAGCSAANLSTYIKRGHVLLRPDGKTIDTEDRVNKDFLLKRASMGKSSSVVDATQSTSIQRTSIQQTNEPKIIPSKKVQKAAEASTISKYNLEVEKMRAEIDKKYIDTELAQQKLSTLLGNNIPIEIVKTIVAQLSKAIINNYKSFSEQQITEICHQNRIGDAERVKFIKSNTTGLNAIHEKAVNDARVQMKHAIGSNKLIESNQDEDE